MVQISWVEAALEGRQPGWRSCRLAGSQPPLFPLSHMLLPHHCRMLAAPLVVLNSCFVTHPAAHAPCPTGQGAEGGGHGALRQRLRRPGSQGGGRQPVRCGGAVAEGKAGRRGRPAARALSFAAFCRPLHRLPDLLDNSAWPGAMPLVCHPPAPSRPALVPSLTKPYS